MQFESKQTPLYGLKLFRLIRWPVLLLFICLGDIARVGAAQVVQGGVTTQESTSTPQDEPTQAPKENPPPASSMTDQLLQNMRGPLGFSVGVFQNYMQEPNAQPVGATSVHPRIFSRFQGQATQLTLDYDFGYRRYGRNGATSAEHSGIVRFERSLSRYLSIQLSNDFRSALNDYGFSVITPLQTQSSGVGQDVYIDRRRVTTNSTGATLNYRVSKNGNLSFSGGYHHWKYSGNDLSGSHSFQVGVQGDYRINRWMFLETRYTSLLSAPSETLRANEIHKLQLAGFRFERRGFEFFGSGGVEMARHESTRQVAAGAQAGVARNIGSTGFSLAYYRGLSRAGALGTILGGDTVTFSITQWLTRRVNLRANVTASQGLSGLTDAKLDSLSGEASAEIALYSHLALSARYWYLSQRTTNLPYATPELTRYVLSGGIQYYLPPLFGR